MVKEYGCVIQWTLFMWNGLTSLVGWRAGVFWSPSSLGVVVVHLLSHVQPLVTPWTAAHQASLSTTNSWSLLKLMSIESVIPNNHPILCHPLLLPSIFPRIRIFSNESVLHIRWPKYWSFSFNINISEYSGMISFRIAVQGTQESSPTPQFKASILWRSVFFIVQLLHPYMTIGKTIWLWLCRPLLANVFAF